MARTECTREGGLCCVGTEVPVWFRKKQSNPTDVIRGLRQQALTVTPAELGLSPNAPDEVWGIITAVRESTPESRSVEPMESVEFDNPHVSTMPDR